MYFWAQLSFARRTAQWASPTDTNFCLTITLASLGYERIAKVYRSSLAQAQRRSAHGLCGPKTFRSIFPTLRQLHSREFDLLSAGFEVSYPETHRRVANVAESMGRAKDNP